LIQTLRDDNNTGIRSKLRQCSRAEDVKNRDRMAMDPIILLGSPEVLDTLRAIDGCVVHQLVPEKYRFSEINKVDMFPNPVSTSCGQFMASFCS